MLLKNQCCFRSQREGTPLSQLTAAVLQAELDGNLFSGSVRCSPCPVAKRDGPPKANAQRAHACAHARAHTRAHACLLFSKPRARFGAIPVTLQPWNRNLDQSGIRHRGELPQRFGEQKLRWMLAAVWNGEIVESPTRQWLWSQVLLGPLINY